MRSLHLDAWLAGIFAVRWRVIGAHGARGSWIRNGCCETISRLRRAGRNLRYPQIRQIRAAVAQLVEQRIRNAWVGGSSPSCGTTISLKLLNEKSSQWVVKFYKSNSINYTSPVADRPNQVVGSNQPWNFGRYTRLDMPSKASKDKHRATMHFTLFLKNHAELLRHSNGRKISWANHAYQLIHPKLIKGPLHCSLRALCCEAPPPHVSRKGPPEF